MSDVSTSGRVDPVIEPPREGFIPQTTTTPLPQAVATPASDSSVPGGRPIHEQLTRIEDKTARIEEKYARTESLLLRVEDKVEATSSRTGELATQADLNALSNRVSSLPGYGALIFTAIIAGIIAAAATYGVMRYGVPGVLPPIAVAAPASSGAMPAPPAAPATVPR